MTETKKKPALPGSGQAELDKAEKQFDEFDENIKKMTMERMSEAPQQEVETQTKISQKDLAKSNDIYLKPFRTSSSREKFNENFREDYEFAKEYVQFIAENKEIIGEEIDLWTKPFPGMPAEEWKVPVNKAVWGPRYLAEQIKKCRYHRFIMQDTRTLGADHAGQYYGQMAVDTTIQRIDANPTSTRKSIFMGAVNF